MVEWTVQKVIKCLKLVVPKERLPKFSMEEFDSFKKYGLFDETDIIKQILEIIYKKSPKTMEMNGSVEDVVKEILEIERVPMLHSFSDDVFEYSEDFILGQFAGLEVFVNQIVPPATNNFDALMQKQILISKTDLLIYFYRAFEISKMSEIGGYLAKHWLLAFMNERYKDLRNSYELLVEGLWNPLRTLIKNLMNSDFANDMMDDECPVNMECIIGFLQDEEVGKKYPKIIEKSKSFLSEQAKKNPKNIDTLYRNGMKELLQIFFTIKRVYESYKDIFSPFPKGGPISEHQVPFIRVFHDIKPFVFSKEFENALRVVMKNRFPNKTFPEGLIQIESEEDRKLGIVYIIDIEKVEKILKIVGLQISDFCIVNKSIPRNFEAISFPTISPYGTYCKLVPYAFQQISHYVLSVLQAFKDADERKFLEITKIIEANVEHVFCQRKSGYCVETWKIEELCDKLRWELRKYIPYVNFEIERKPNYGKKEIVKIIRELSKPLVFKEEIIEAYYSKEIARSNGIRYHHIFLFYNMSIYEKMIPFIYQLFGLAENSAKVVPKNVEVKEFSTMKKGFLIQKPSATVKEKNGKENVEKKQEKADPKLEEMKKHMIENDEKSKTEIKKLQEKLRELNEKCESTQGLLKDREDDVNNWKNKFEICEADLKRSQQEKEEKDEQILKLQTEIEQLKELSEEKIRKLEEEHRNEVERCRNENQNLMENFEKLKIEKKKIAENARLQSRTSEDSFNHQAFEQWFMTGYKLLEKNKRNPKVAERLEKYRRLLEIDYDDLIDTLSSQLNRLILSHPNSAEIKLIRTQVSDFDEQLDDYIKNIRKEIKKLRENTNANPNEQLGEEIEQFPNDRFLKIYRKWVKNDDLEKLLCA